LEKESQQKLKQHLIQLREELIIIKRLLHECRVGFKTIRETGNLRVADVFLEELNNELNEL